MARVLIANIDNENLMADDRARTPEHCLEVSRIAGRMAWFAEPGDVVVLPRDLSPLFKHYVGKLMGYAPEAVAYVTPDWNGAPVRTFGIRELLHLGVREKLGHLMQGRGCWSMFPYCYERSVELLAEALGLDTEGEVRPFMRQGGAELLNDKRVFRSLAAGRGIALARGVIAAGRQDLEDAIGSLIDETGSVIVKQDRHGGGLGNLIVSRKADLRGLGATGVIPATDEPSLRAAVAEVWRRLAYFERAPLVVEVYYAAAAAVTAEFKLDRRDNSVAFLNCGEVRQTPIISGLIMPWTLPPYLAGAFIAGATELARLSCDLGYDGLINIDGIITTDGGVIYNEFNGRIGGCSHIHHVLQSLAGPGYGDRLVVVSHSRAITLGIEHVLDLLRRAQLEFDATAGRGLILTAEDAAGSGYLEYLSIAPSRAEAMQLETAFERLLDNGVSDDRPAGIEHLEKILSHLPTVGPEGSSESAEPERTALSSAARKA